MGSEDPQTDIFAYKDVPKLRKCRIHWHKGDSAWPKHWRSKEWGLYWDGLSGDTRKIVNKIIVD